MKSKYDLDENTPIRVIRKRLKEARREDRIYVVARIIGVLQWQGCKDDLTAEEKKSLLKNLKLVRGGHKVLANWLPIGYQIARFLMLVRGLSVKQVSPTKRDIDRIRRAAYCYKHKGDWHSRRQLRSLISTAKLIGITIYRPHS